MRRLYARYLIALQVQAAHVSAGELAADRIPSVRAIRARLHVGQPRAQRVRAYLASLTGGSVNCGRHDFLDRLPDAGRGERPIRPGSATKAPVPGRGPRRPEHEKASPIFSQVTLPRGFTRQRVSGTEALRHHPHFWEGHPWAEHARPLAAAASC
jgi:hypothetical protein